MKPLVQPSWALWGRRRAPHVARRGSAPPRPGNAYTAFVAYANVPAARDALARVSALLRARGDDCRLQPMLWRCDQLDDPRWREMALRDAARADVLVLAFARNAPLDGETEAWLAELTHHVRGAELTALAFTGDDDGWTISLRAEMQPHVAHGAPALKLTGPKQLAPAPAPVEDTGTDTTTVTARAA